jgi:hypothetical protein
MNSKGSATNGAKPRDVKPVNRRAPTVAVQTFNNEQKAKRVPHDGRAGRNEKVPLRLVW